MEFNFGILLIVSFSSVLLSSSPLALCHLTLAPSPFSSSVPVSYISEAPAYIPIDVDIDAPAPTSYISDVPASSPEPSLAPDSNSPAPSPSFPAASSPVPSATAQFAVDIHSGAFDPVDLTVIKKICDVTENPELCANSILPYLKGAINPLSALQTEINIFLNLTEKALTQLKASANNPATSSFTLDGLKVCLDIYNSAKDDLKQALNAIASNDMGLLKSVLSGAITDLGTCDDTFAETSGDELPLDNDLVATLHKLANNCMDISAVLL